MLDDLSMALRSLVRRPGFTALSVLTLALAAGANAAIFGVVYGVLLKPLPYGDPEELVAMWPVASNADLLYLREHARGFSAIATVAPGWTMALTGAGEPAKITVARVSGNLFETLKVRADVGRTFSESQARRGADSVVLLSHALWVRQFGADPAVVGRAVRLEGEPYDIWGVLPEDFEVFGLKSDAYTPFALDASAWYHQLSFSLFVARLAPGVRFERAEREYLGLIPALRRDRGYPADYGRTARLQDLRSATVGDVKASLVLVGGAVLLILLMAGANVGTLLLTRAARRSREFAVRAAIGASRARIARELFAESALLALAGGMAGVLLARAMLPAIVAVLPKDTPRLTEIAIDSIVMAAVLGTAVIVALVFGAAPALTAARLKPAPFLHAGTSTESRHDKRVRALLVCGEIALALVLAIGASLMLQTLRRLNDVDPGFNPQRVLALHLQPTDVGAQGARTTAGYYQLVLERLRALPGVTAAGAIQHLPFSGYSWTAALDVEGVNVAAGASRPTAGLRVVTPGYFKAIQQPLLAGRDFTVEDAVRRDVVIVSRGLANRHFGSVGRALGRRLRTRGGGTQSPWMRVAGVVGDIRHSALTSDPESEIYTSVSANSINAMMLAIRTVNEPLSLVPQVREAIWSVDRNVPISDVQTMNAKMGASLSHPRLMMIVLTGFAAVGLVLSVIGVYGVCAYSVAQRRREIGIIIALGAERSRVVRAVLRQGLLYGLGGIGAGIPAALASSRLMRSLLYGVTPTDPVTYLVLAAIVTGVVTCACVLPARRASQVDPVAALRSD